MANNTIGRIPPHNNDAEVALLGSILLRNRAFDDVQTMLVKEDFYDGRHQVIWEALNGIRNERPSLTIDLVSLSQYLAEKKNLERSGGAVYIATLTDSVPSSVNAVYYAELIKNCSLKRQLLELSMRIGDKVFDESEDVKSSIDDLEQKVMALGTTSGSNNYKDAGQLLKLVVDDVHKKQRGEKSDGVSSGFKTLDKYIGGFRPSEMIIIAARPSVGKTAFALSIAANMAFGSNPVKVGFFSLEMSGASLMERIISNKAQINNMSLRNGKLDRETDNKMMCTADELYDKAQNLLIQDTPNIKLMEIRSQGRRMVREEGVRVIFIDYIGLVDLAGPSTMPRHEQVSIISRSIKQLARELEVPIICLSQVNREGGKDRPPMLADLRDSGSIEQDADLVMMLDDPSKRLNEEGKIQQYEDDGSSEAENPQDVPPVKTRQIKIIIAKQRNGSTGAFNLNFLSDYVAFREIDRF